MTFPVPPLAGPDPAVPLLDRALVARIRLGDAEAFSTMFLACYTPLVRFAYRYLRTQADAEEAVQEVMVRIWEQRVALAEDVNLKTYLYSAVRNRAIDQLRRRHRMLHFEEQAVVEGTTPAMGQIGADADEKLESEDVQAWVDRAVAALAPRCRQIFLLHRVHHLTYAEIAAAMGISPRTVQVQMGRALKALRQRLQ